MAWCFEGFCDDISEIILLQRRRYLRHACTVMYVLTCLRCLAGFHLSRSPCYNFVYDFMYDCSDIVCGYGLQHMWLRDIR